ncbi:MAG: DUF2905 domain-containing protein [Caldilineaceae bacterium]
MFTEVGRMLMIVGGLLFLVGLVLTFAGRLPGFGHLPGDVAIERSNFRLYAPFGTMILLSILLTVLLNVIARLFR